MATDEQRVEEGEPTIREMEDSLRRTQLALKTRTASRMLKLQEAFFNTPLQGELINPLEQLFDGDRLLYPLYPSRRDGNRINNVFQSEAQLDLSRAYARYLYDSNSYASGAVDGLCNYVVKAGYGYNVSVKRRGRRADAGPAAEAQGDAEALRDAAQAILDEFTEANDWPQYERELFRRTRRDGEAFVRFFPDEDGPTVVRVVEPEQVRAPNTDRDWGFGVRTSPDDLLTVEGYWVTYTGDPADGEEVPPEDIHHIKVNVDRNSRRGISDFFAVGQQLESAKKLLRNSREGEAVRSAIAYLREHAMADAGAIQALQAASTDPQLSFTQPLTGRAVSVMKVEPGSVQDIPEGMTHKSIPAYSSAPAVELVAATLQAVAAKWQCPVWLISGDASGGNYAQGLVAESPFTLAVESAQGFYQAAYRRVLWRVLVIAVEQGRLDARALAALCIQAEAPPVTPRNKADENAINTTLSEKGLLSDQTWSVREDLDYEREQENRREEAAKKVVTPREFPTKVTASLPPAAPPAAAPQAPPSGTPAAQYQRDIRRPA